MSDQVALGEPAASSSASRTNQEANLAAELVRLRDEGRPLSSQELKELNARVKTLEEIAKLEGRLRALDDQRRPRSTDTDRQSNQPSDRLSNRQSDRQSNQQPDRQSDYEEPEHTMVPLSSLGRYSVIRPSIESDEDESSSSDTIRHRHKRRRYTKGIKITPSYTLKVSSSLREWGDWKRDIERVFEGDPDMYQRGSQKILKALDYLEPSLKSLWYTYSEQNGGVRK